MLVSQDPDHIFAEHYTFPLDFVQLLEHFHALSSMHLGNLLSLAEMFEKFLLSLDLEHQTSQA